MKITQINMIKIVVCAIVIIGCTNNTANKENLFADMYKNCEMNTLLKMDFIGKLYEGDRDVNFSLEPISNTSVIFPADFNIKLLSYDSEQHQWIEIKNNIQYFPVDAKYIVGKNDPIKEDEYSLISVIPSLGRKAELRIVLHGNVFESGIEADKCAGVYVDFEFTP